MNSLTLLIAQLIQRREDLGMFQRELSRRIGVSTTMVSQWENGWWSPTPKNFIKWVDALELDLVLVPREDED